MATPRAMLVAAVVLVGTGTGPGTATERRTLTRTAAPEQVRIRRARTPAPSMYRPPVTAPVRDPFRPPPEPWLAGNRGIEYATAPGTPVRAIGPGVVTFAGTVAGEHDVTVTHPDGLRSSYVDLAALRVTRGDRVEADQVVGVATDRLHLGVRRGDTYLDPALLWGRRVGGARVVLVPLDDRSPRIPRPPPASGADRPAPRSAATRLGRSLVAATAGVVGAVAAGVSAPRP